MTCFEISYNSFKNKLFCCYRSDFYLKAQQIMNVIKNKVISLKICKKHPEEDLPSPDPAPSNKINYRRRFSLPYGKIVDSWKKENIVVSTPREEEEYPIYQSASFKR